MRNLLILVLFSPLLLPACDSGDDSVAGDDGGGTDDEGGGDVFPENTSAACRDGIDNDGDGTTDCDDLDCAEFVFCISTDADADVPDTEASDADATDDSVDVPDGEVVETAEDAGDGESEDDVGPACAPGDDGCGAVEICGDGLDNDCDGAVDEADAGCTCTYGDVQACLPGPPCGRGVGGCIEGWQACAADGTWLPCAEAIAAEDEIPDGKDNDCDGESDEGLSMTPTIVCPVSFESLPGRYWVLRCEDFCSPTAGGPCDCSWSIRSPESSGTIEVPDRLLETTRVYLDVAGVFVITVTILDPALNTWRCSFAVRTVPPGIQVDLWWDDPDPWQPGNLDLHVHRNPPRTPWFTDDDCHWGNCGGRDGTYLIDWGYADTPLADCPDLPPERSWWDFVPRGGCPNPRLPLESFDGTAGETFSLDNPRTGDAFRVMTHYYMDGASFVELPADAYVRITCGGRPTVQYGPVRMTSRDYGTGDLWRSADVQILDPSGECAVVPLGMPTAPDVQGDSSRDFL